MRGWIFEQHGPITLKKNKRLPRIERHYRISGACVNYRNPATLYVLASHAPSFIVLSRSAASGAPPGPCRSGLFFPAFGKPWPGRYKSLSVSDFPTHFLAHFQGQAIRFDILI